MEETKWEREYETVFVTGTGSLTDVLNEAHANEYEVLNIANKKSTEYSILTGTHIVFRKIPKNVEEKEEVTFDVKGAFKALLAILIRYIINIGNKKDRMNRFSDDIIAFQKNYDIWVIEPEEEE